MTVSEEFSLKIDCVAVAQYNLPSREKFPSMPGVRPQKFVKNCLVLWKARVSDETRRLSGAILLHFPPVDFDFGMKTKGHLP